MKRWEELQGRKRGLIDVLAELQARHGEGFTMEIFKEVELFFDSATAETRGALMEGRISLRDAMTISKVGETQKHQQHLLLAMVQDLKEPLSIE